MRNLQPTDFDFVTHVIDDWWGGRPMRQLLSRIFFDHFIDTSFAVPAEDGLHGFLIGFQSQSTPTLGYIHFVGVAPEARGSGIARAMYQRFFDAARARGCREVRSITSPANAGSIAFHQALGFTLQPSAHVENGVPVTPDYSGPGQSRVVFVRPLTA